MFNHVQQLLNGLFPLKKINTQFTKLPAELNEHILKFIPEKTLQNLKQTHCSVLALAAENRQKQLDKTFPHLTKLVSELDSAEDVIYFLIKLQQFIQQIAPSADAEQLLDDSMNLILHTLLFLTQRHIVKFIYKVEIQPICFLNFFPEEEKSNIPLAEIHLNLFDQDVRTRNTKKEDFLLAKHTYLDEIISYSFLENSCMLALNEGNLKKIFDLARETLTSIHNQIQCHINQNATHRLGRA